MSSSGRAEGKKRGKREDRIGRAVGPRARFWGAVAALPAFLLTDGLLPRALILALFAVLAVLAGKKIRWGYFGILILSVTISSPPLGAFSWKSGRLPSPKVP